jgi:crotonobetainyl-CoA:carnitine CoA-transferase CaiB-like acyl-CoA transferase
VLVARAGGGAAAPARLPALPMEFGAGRARPPLRAQPPRVGEHSRAVLAEGGLAEGEIARLVADGVVLAG